MTYDALTPPCPDCSHPWPWAEVVTSPQNSTHALLLRTLPVWIKCVECGALRIPEGLDVELNADRIRHLERQAEQ